MNKEAGTFGDFIKGIYSAGSDVYKGLANLTWLTVPAAAILATVGGVRALRPEAVAENSDKLLVNETLKASLAKSIREREEALRRADSATAYNNIRRHDRFI